MNISGQVIDVTDQWAANNSASGFLVGKITQLFSLLCLVTCDLPPQGILRLT